MIYFLYALLAAVMVWGVFAVEGFVRYLRFAKLARAIHQGVQWVHNQEDFQVKDWPDLTARERRFAIELTIKIFGEPKDVAWVLTHQYGMASADQTRVTITRAARDALAALEGT